MNQMNNSGRYTLQVRAKGRPFGELTLFGRMALLIFAMHAVGCGDKDKEKAQTPPVTSAPQPPQPTPATPPVPKPEAKPLTSLESLVAPIALYPDPLLAEVLVAATYPLEVVQAARWLETKPDLATVRTKNWDASVSRLTAVPDVIAMMDQHLDWTTQLGDAFLSDPSQLMDAVQTLRRRATDAGFLKASDLQKVETKTVSVQEPGQEAAQTEGVKATPAVLTKEVIYIEPAKADTISVPSYNPEVVYSAPMAPPPASPTYSAAPAASYYPTYYAPPATTTTTTSSGTDQWMSFGAGAVVGGLLTWGIMEWADDDDWDDYHVGHYYGDSVCHGGNCWSGGGGGYYGGNANINRGNVNVDRDVNFSGNEINFNRDGTFNQDQLPAMKDRAGGRWQPDARHRRGQAFPPKAQQRMGRAESPALAGNRLSGAQNLPADMRGFGQAGGAGRAAPARLSSADVQQRLAGKSGRETRPGMAESRGRPMQGSRENALEGLRSSGQRSNFESQRGASSLGARQQGIGQARAKDRAGTTPRRTGNVADASQRRSQQAVQRPGQQQQLARQRNEQAQRQQAQRRQETSRPSAFDSARDGGRSSAYSNRGSASFARTQQPARQMPSRAQPARQSSSYGGQRPASRGSAGGASRGGGGASRGGGGGRSRGGR
ncbi:DUF3300 domain-containing protein [Methylomicrobium lacus]|uniref:DUF3300 domain-containing protein n=1 Tax=Methylomicrobium lacus TaxID=136992 RepID=UPI0035A9649C